VLEGANMPRLDGGAELAHDSQARSIYHRTRDSIPAHLTIVFASLAASRPAHQIGPTQAATTRSRSRPVGTPSPPPTPSRRPTPSPSRNQPRQMTCALGWPNSGHLRAPVSGRGPGHPDRDRHGVPCCLECCRKCCLRIPPRPQKPEKSQVTGQMLVGRVGLEPTTYGQSPRSDIPVQISVGCCVHLSDARPLRHAVPRS
jgi:hypothetical protein